MRIILAIFFFTGFVAFSFRVIAQEKKDPIDGHGILFKFIDSLNRNIVMESMAPADTLDNTKVLAAINESQINYSDGSDCLSPDKRFKIITAEGTDCTSGRCICLNAAKLYLATTRKLLDLPNGFLNIDTIYKIGSNEYLALQSSHSCQGTAISFKQATFFSIINNKVINHSLTNEDDHLCTVFQQDIDELSKFPLILKFDERSRRLIYSYILDTDTSINTDTENYITGYYEYKGGTFCAGKIIIKRPIKR